MSSTIWNDYRSKGGNRCFPSINVFFENHLHYLQCDSVAIVLTSFYTQRN